MTGPEVMEALRANYFAGAGYETRTSVDASGFARIIVLAIRGGRRSRLFGLRLVDYEVSPPTLRFWRPERWDDANFDFDFTLSGDAGSGTATSPQGVPTMCIPYHVDYYRGGWHKDYPWSAVEADALIADLVANILRRS
jgi:hypothetical protein